MNTIIETPAQQIARLTAENMKLKAAVPKPKALTFKVTAKGGISIYGFGRFPFTFYPEQLARLSKAMPEIEKFAADNAALLQANSDAYAKLPKEQ